MTQETMRVPEKIVMVPFTERHMNITLAALSERPYREVVEVMNLLLHNIEQQTSSVKKPE
jgi:hypothetical protein